MPMLFNVFRSVSKTLNFSKTAKEFNVSPSTISRQIDKLEYDMGLKLFIRNTKSLLLTPEGKVFAKEAEYCMGRLESVIAQLENPDFKLAKSLKITTFETFGKSHVLPAIVKLLEKNPVMNFNVELDNNLHNISQKNFDLFIRVGKPQDSDFIYKKLQDNNLGIYSSQKYLDKIEPLNKIEDLEGLNWMIVGSQNKKTDLTIVSRKKKYQLKVRGNLTSSGGTPLLEALNYGLGVALVPHWLIPKNSNIVQLFPRSTCRVLGQNFPSIYALYRKELKNDVRLKMFFEALNDEIFR